MPRIVVLVARFNIVLSLLTADLSPISNCVCRSMPLHLHFFSLIHYQNSAQ